MAAPLDLGPLGGRERGGQRGRRPVAVGPGPGELVEGRAGRLAGRLDVAELADPGELGVAELGLAAATGRTVEAAAGVLAARLLVGPRLEPGEQAAGLGRGGRPARARRRIRPRNASERARARPRIGPRPSARRAAVEDHARPRAGAARPAGAGPRPASRARSPATARPARASDREGRQGGGGGLAAGPLPEPLAGADPAGQDRRAGQEAAEVVGQGVGRRRSGGRGSLARHFRQIVSRSRERPGRSLDGGTGSSWTTW